MQVPFLRSMGLHLFDFQILHIWIALISHDCWLQKVLDVVEGVTAPVLFGKS